MDEGRENIKEFKQREQIISKENEILKRKIEELLCIKEAYEKVINQRKYRVVNRICKFNEMEERIGGNGRNLTWVIKGEERTIKLLNSFLYYEKNFQGEIIIAGKDIKEELQRQIKNILDGKIAYFFYKTKGTSKYDILNEVTGKVKTEWIIYMDSQFVFIKNCLEELESCLLQSGCYFMNLPVVSAESGWIYENQLEGDDEIVRYTKEVPKFSATLNVKAFIYKKDIFSELGGFATDCAGDEKSNLIKNIFSSNYAIANAQDAFLVSSENDEEVKGIRKKNRLRIALVVDTENWAYHNIAKQMKKKLSDMDIDIYFYDYTPNTIQIVLSCKNYDIVHFLWREVVDVLTPERAVIYLRQIGMSYEEFKRHYLDKMCITTSVYDHMCLDTPWGLKSTGNIIELCNAYTVSSNKLFKIYEKEFEKKPFGVITDGVDLEKFYPIDSKRSLTEKGLVVGWVGNSCFWGNTDLDLKGVNTIVKPAISQLQKEGVEIVPYFADRQERIIPHDRMCEYYSKINVLVCSSLTEGTPNPVLEAMACGIPVISTDVGIVYDVMGEYQKKFIMEERTIECLKRKLLYFYENKDALKMCSEENLIRIKQWSWEIKMEEFRHFFVESYNKFGKAGQSYET